MGTADVMMDWLRARHDLARVRPVSAAALAALAASGAPDALLSLSRAVGGGFAGLLVDSVTSVVAPRWDPAVGWQVAETELGRLYLRDGSVFLAGPTGSLHIAPSLDHLLEVRLQRLIAGSLVWDPDTEGLVDPERVRDLGAAAADPAAFGRWTDDLLAALADGADAPLGPLGALRVSRSSAFDSDTRRPLSTSTTEFRPSAWLQQQLGGGLAAPVGPAEQVAAAEAVAVALRRSERARWPRLGTFASAIDGTAAEPVRVAFFLAAPSLRRLLEPEPS
ncbi:MAG: hypothetical protein R3F59_09030 [Myxococcota bacterium]